MAPTGNGTNETAQSPPKEKTIREPSARAGQRPSDCSSDGNPRESKPRRASEPELLANSPLGFSDRSSVGASSRATCNTTNSDLRRYVKELDDEDRRAKRESKRQSSNATSVYVPPIVNETTAPSSRTVKTGLAQGLPSGKFGNSRRTTSSAVSSLSNLSSVPGAYSNMDPSSGRQEEAKEEEEIEPNINVPRAPSETLLVVATLVPQDNETALVVEDAPTPEPPNSAHPQVLSKIAEAERAGLRDFLQNKRLQCFILALVCFVAVFVTIVVWQIAPQVEGNDATTNQADERIIDFTQIAVPATSPPSFRGTESPSGSPLDDSATTSPTPQKPTTTPSAAPTYFPTISPYPSYSNGFTGQYAYYKTKLLIDWGGGSAQYLADEQKGIIEEVLAGYTAFVAGADEKVITTRCFAQNQRIEYLDLATPYLDLEYMLRWESCHLNTTSQYPELFLQWQKQNQDKISNDLEVAGLSATLFDGISYAKETPMPYFNYNRCT